MGSSSPEQSIVFIMHQHREHSEGNSPRSPRSRHISDAIPSRKITQAAIY